MGKCPVFNVSLFSPSRKVQQYKRHVDSHGQKMKMHVYKKVCTTNTYVRGPLRSPSLVGQRRTHVEFRSKCVVPIWFDETVTVCGAVVACEQTSAQNRCVCPVYVVYPCPPFMTGDRSDFCTYVPIPPNSRRPC